MSRLLKRRQLFLLILGVPTAILLLLGVTYNYFLSPLDSDTAKRTEFIISPGQNLNSITHSLESQSLVRSALVLRFYIITHKLNNNIQAGYFYLSPSDSGRVIAEMLTHAVSKQTRITIPEGLRREEIANRILDALDESKLPHNFDPELFIEKTKNIEGRLYPDTYDFHPGVTTAQVISRLTDQFDLKVAGLNLKPDNLNNSLILASLIEREAGADSERPEIAGILTNRLNNDWPLQVDATVQYAISSLRCRNRHCIWWPRPLTRLDLEVVSPFNTYRQIGLPPSPIGNPGLSSLEAAANPKITNNWFYLHDPSGQIHYAVTVEQHNHNVCTFLKKGC